LKSFRYMQCAYFVWITSKVFAFLSLPQRFHGLGNDRNSGKLYEVAA
jgi:hypothetical protein